MSDNASPVTPRRMRMPMAAMLPVMLGMCMAPGVDEPMPEATDSNRRGKTGWARWSDTYGPRQIGLELHDPKPEEIAAIKAERARRKAEAFRRRNKGAP